MKAGHTADALHVRFVGEGEDPEEVRAVLTELVALQHQAAAMDPDRLRGEARWMFGRGASVDDVVAHFVGVGVSEAHARAEAQRLEAAFRSLRPCQRCGTPTEPERMCMDLSGFSICPGCHLRDEIARSEQRAVARDLEMVGAMAGVGGLVAMSFVADAMSTGGLGQTSRPFCARCRQPTGVHVSQIAPAFRAQIDPTAEWACGHCGQKIA
jgi:hypothetical protein